MTKQEIQKYIESKLIELASQKYDNPDLQRTYIIGFLTAQLADAMYNDSQYAAKFRRQVTKSQ